MPKVNPVEHLRIPKQFTNEADSRKYFRDLQFIIFQLSGIATSGDSFTELKDGTTSYTQLQDDNVIYCNSSTPFTIDMLASDQGLRIVIIKNYGLGTVTLVPNGSESVEVSILTMNQSVTLGPRLGVGWVVL